MHAVAKLLHGPPLPHQIDQHPAGFDQPPVQIGQLPHEQIRPTHRLHRHTGVLPEAVDVDRPQQRIPRPVAIGIQMPLPFPQLLLERLLSLLQGTDDLLLSTFLRPSNIQHRLIWKRESTHETPTWPAPAAACWRRTEVVASSTSCRHVSG